MPYIGNSPGTGTRNRFIYTATASQTTFSGADDNGKTLKYADSDYVDVYLNGICLVPVTDYTSTSKTSIVLTQAASLNDTLEVVAYDIATISDTVSKADGGNFEAGVNIDGNVGIGTTSPLRSLHVSGAGDTGLMLQTTNATDDKEIWEIQSAADSSSEANLIFRTRVNAGTGGTEAMRIDNDGNVGIGSTDPSTRLHIVPPDNTTANKITQGFGSARANANDVVAGGFDSEFVTRDGNVNTGAFVRVIDTNTNSSFPTTIRGGVLSFGTVDGTSGSSADADEKMRIDHLGRVMIGTTTEGAANEAEELTISGTDQVGITLRSTNSGGGRIYFSDGTSGTPEYAGYIIYNHSSNEMIFGTNATEQFRVTNDKQLFVGTTTAVGSSQAGVQVAGTDGFNFWRSSTTATTGYDQCVYINGNGVVGRITTSGSGTSYGTTSDYRLKENVTDVTDGITRVKQLSPKRFNFIADADTKVDGFLAHEAATVVPEAVTGTKDAVEVWKEHEELPDGVSVGDNKLDDDGNTIPEYQGIDQSKIVPLLTAALQEAIAKIETLETKVAALEAE